jgi:hypothetical protein
MGTEAPLYRSTDALDKLARRTTKYQFDIERDIAWQADDSDRFFPLEFLRDLGVDVQRLEPHVDALRAFQWSLALCVCRQFADSETIVVRFVAESGEKLQADRSLVLLDEEEQKHIALFKRLAEGLLARRPEWAQSFEDAYRPTASFSEKTLAAHFQRDLYPNEATRHYVFWLATIFFEEFTIYIDERVSSDTSLNALWRSAHAAHRREEVQHVATDIAYVDALDLSEDERMPWSDVFVTRIVGELRLVMGLDAPAAFVSKLFPAVGHVLVETAPHEAPFLREIRHRAEFKRSRAYLPSLELFGE